MTTVNHNMTSQRSRSQLVVLLHFGDGGTRSCHPYPADLRHRSSHPTHVPTNCGTRAPRRPGMSATPIVVNVLAATALSVALRCGHPVGDPVPTQGTSWQPG